MCVLHILCLRESVNERVNRRRFCGFWTLLMIGFSSLLPSRGHVMLPTWALVWLQVSLLVVLWDASFVLLRPASMAGGEYEAFFEPYKKYITIDKVCAQFAIAVVILTIH